MPQKKRLYLICCVAALGGLLFGFDTGVISGAILFINNDFHLNHIQSEVVVSSVLFGALIGAGLGGRLCDMIGRKKIIIITAVIFIIGTLICSYTPNRQGLIIGRVILGFAIGIASFSAPLYLAEIAPPTHRGLLVSLNQLAITLGILGSYLVNYYFSSEAAWRYMLLSGIVPAVLLFIGVLFLPESPRFLATKKKWQKAKKVLMTVRKHHAVEQELNDMVKNSQHLTQNWLSLFSDIKITFVLFIGITLAVLQQVTGINTIIYYAPTVFKLAGFHASHAIFVTIFVGVINVIATLIALPLVDKVGRKPLLFIGVTGMGISLIFLGLCFNQHPISFFMRYIALLSMMSYIACFAISLGPMVFIIIAEIFPLSIRGLGMSFAMMANWTANMIVAITFLSFIHSLGITHTFYFFAAICALTILFIHFFIPETKGISLEQIESNIHQGVKGKHLGRPT